MSAFTTPLYPGINPDDNYGPHLNVVGVAFICLSFVTLALRFISRKVTNIELKLDDWLVILAAVLSWGYTAGVIHEVLYNFYGQHIGKSDMAHLEDWLKGLFGIAILYPIALTASKLSLLALYHRIFGATKAKIPLNIAAGLNISWMIAAVLVGIFSCSPVEGFWDMEVPSTCIQEYVFFLSNECITIALDLVVLLMPIYYISQIKRSLSQRVSICSTFALGLIATVVSAIRLWQLVLAQQRPGFDPIFNDTGAALWAIIELNVWVMVACIPALRPLFLKARIRFDPESGEWTVGSYTISIKAWKTKESWSNSSKDVSSTRSTRPITLPSQRPLYSSPSVPNFSTHISGRKASLSGAGKNREMAQTEPEGLTGIRIERGFEIAPPEVAHAQY